MNKSVNATGIFARYMNLRSDRTYVFRTVTRAGDPVMHIWGDYIRFGELVARIDREVAFNDDYAPWAPFGSNARVEYHPEVDGERVILGRSFGGSIFGIGTVMVCERPFPTLPADDRCDENATPTDTPKRPAFWRILDLNARFRGTVLPPDLAVGGGHEYHTVMVNAQAGGSDDSLLLGLGQDGHLVAFDDDSGVGLMDHISAFSGAPDSIAELMVGAYGREGRVHVYANDANVDDIFTGTHDYDGDGVGRALEFWLGSCDHPATAPTTQSYCVGKDMWFLRDADRDGLLDGDEIFGVEDEEIPARNPQHLPAWGADPEGSPHIAPYACVKMAC